ncbi:MAG: hypothetical protein ABIR91_03660 [Candidatus Saccharimonadales bacterium]
MMEPESAPPYQIIPNLYRIIDDDELVKFETAVTKLDLLPYRVPESEEQYTHTDDGRVLKHSLLLLSPIRPTERGPNAALVKQAAADSKRLYRLMGTLHFDEHYFDGLKITCYGAKTKYVDTMMINVRRLNAMLSGCGVDGVTISFTEQKPRFVQVSLPTGE